MHIARVSIENFRSIKSIDFQPGPYCVLIGENNSGKTNILRALNLILGETWPSERGFSDEDFHNQDTSKDVVIRVFFSEELEEWRNNFPVKVGGFELRCKAYKRRVKDKPAGSLKADYVCIDSAGKVANQPSEKLEKGQQFKGRWTPMKISKELRGRIPFIFVDAFRDYGSQSPNARWSVLRRLFDSVNAEFLNDKKTVNVVLDTGEKQKMSRREAFEHTVKSAYQYLRTESFSKIEESLTANAKEHMGLPADKGDIQLHFESHDASNAYKSLQLYVEQLGIKSPAGEVGAGLQSALVIAIFRTYQELKREGGVFGIEEPEVFLHPQKARYFSTVLSALAEAGNQLFLTTHSPIFVQLHKPECVVVVRRTEAEGTTVRQADKVDMAETDRAALRLLTEFDAQRKELFFAKKVLLVEGMTEKLALPMAFRRLGIDVNRAGISVVECGGKTKIPLFVRVVKALGLPFVVIADHDVKEAKEEWSDKRKKAEADRNTKHERWNSDIESVAGDKVYWLRPDFEAELSLSRDTTEKLDQACTIFSDTDFEVPACLSTPMRALLAEEP